LASNVDNFEVKVIGKNQVVLNTYESLLGETMLDVDINDAVQLNITLKGTEKPKNVEISIIGCIETEEPSKFFLIFR
jgi:hypothetical protein